jgi:hypothetical protein
MAVMVTELDEALAILRVCAVLSTPIVCPVKLRLVGVVVSGALPVPLSPTSANRLSLLLYMLAAPEMAPVKVGAKEIFAVQEPPAAILPLQLSVSVKSPLITISMGCAAAPSLVTFNAVEALVVPTNVLGSVKLAFETVICAEALTPPATNKAASNRTV